MTRRACFIGRWQPWHKGHEWLINQKLGLGIPALILVRDIPPDAGNPFTTEQTVEMIESAMAGRDVVVQVIPDIESVNWGRGVGYETNEFKPPEDVGAISATEIRRQVRTGQEDWKGLVSESIWSTVERLLTTS